jgi:multidrug efflux pump subunit AcrA (membrane-fusion protein)
MMGIPSVARQPVESSERDADRRIETRGLGAGRRTRRAGAILLGVALVVAAGAWAYHANVGSGRSTMEMQVSGSGTAFPVALAAVERRVVSGAVTYTGSVAPFAEEDIYPRVTGRIVEMPVYPGDAVQPGQVVARLDDVELGSRVREAAASVAAADANLAQMEADVVAARHGVIQMDRELAMVEAEAEYQEQVWTREERLFGVGAVARQDVENTRAMVTAARAKVAAGRARAEQARAMEASTLRKRDAMAAMATMSRAQLRTAEVIRDYVTIVAPSAGYVAKRMVAPGVLVQPGTAILKIARLDRVRLQANVGEKDIAAMRVGAPVTVTTTDGRPPVEVRVTAVFPFVDQGPRTAVVEALVPNPERRFLPGQYVTMAFVKGERGETLSVPRGAVTRTGGRARVWVAVGGRAQPREVTTGLENPERVEITDGLRGDEQVVARGHEPLYAGAPVREVRAGIGVRGPVAPSPGGAPVGVGHEGHATTAPAAPAPLPAEPAKEVPHVGH